MTCPPVGGSTWRRGTAWVTWRPGSIEAAERAPQGTEDELRDAAGRVREEVALGREASAALPDDNYEAAAVRDGTLFKVSEKSRSLVFRTLDLLRVELGEGTVPRRCGRQPKVVSLPV